MTDHKHHTPASLAVFTLAEIKAATAAFESGDANVFSTLDAIAEAIANFRAAAVHRGGLKAA